MATSELTTLNEWRVNDEQKGAPNSTTMRSMLKEEEDEEEE